MTMMNPEETTIIRQTEPGNGRNVPHWGCRRVIAMDAFLDGTLRMALLDPELLLKSAALAKDSRSTTAGTVEVNGQCIFLKRSNVSGFFNRLRRMWRPSRAEKNLRGARVLEKLNIRTPKVYMALSTWERWLPGPSYLATEAFPHPMTLAECLPQILAELGMEELIARMCRIMAVLHEHGWIHGDLKLHNWLALREESGWQLGLMDLDGMSHYPRCCTARLRRKELARTASSMILELRLRVPEARTAIGKIVDLWCIAYAEAGGCDFAGDRIFVHRMLRFLKHRRKKSRV